MNSRIFAKDFGKRLRYELGMSRIVILLFLCLNWAAAYAANLGKIQGRHIVSGQWVNRSVEGKKGMVVVFLSIRCPSSHSHLAELKDLAREFKDFEFVGVNSNQNEVPDESRRYFQKQNLEIPVILDKGAVIADQYKALKTPHVFVVNSAGEIVYQGGISNSRDINRASRKYLRLALNEIQNGKPVTLPEGKALGCTISRGEKNVW
jgi:thiol-disulfide isomerase/thioredoxin